MELTIITLNWNGKEKIEKLYPSLEEECNNLLNKNLINSWNWHVKDNGSKDGSIDFLKLCNNTIVYEVGHNRDNFSKGINYLVDKSKPKHLILLLNNDVFFGGNFDNLEKMLLLKNKHKTGIVGAKLKYSDTNQIQHYIVAFSKKYGEMPWHIFSKEPDSNKFKYNKYSQAVTAALMLTDISTFSKVGGFNESYNWAFEDIDFCLKVNALKNNNIISCGDVEIFHEESASLKKNPVNKMFLQNNVNEFKKNWMGKYILDFENYEKDEKFRNTT